MILNETGQLCSLQAPIFSSYMVCPHWSENSMPCLLWEVSHIGTNQEIFRSPPTNPTTKKWWIGRMVRSISWNKFSRSAPSCAGGGKHVIYILRKLWLEFWKSTEFCPTMCSPVTPPLEGVDPSSSKITSQNAIFTSLTLQPHKQPGPTSSDHNQNVNYIFGFRKVWKCNGWWVGAGLLHICAWNL